MKPGEQHDDADHLQAELLDQLPDQHRKAGGRAAHLQRRAGDHADDDTADDAGDDARRGRHAGGERDAHAQRQRDEKDDDRRHEVATESRLSIRRVHEAPVRSLNLIAGRGTVTVDCKPISAVPQRGGTIDLELQPGKLRLAAGPNDG